MNATDFYNKTLKEDNTIGSIELMEKYAKHVIEINLCTGAPIDFYKNTMSDLKTTNQVVNLLVDWVNS